MITIENRYNSMYKIGSLEILKKGYFKKMKSFNPKTRNPWQSRKSQTYYTEFSAPEFSILPHSQNGKLRFKNRGKNF